MTVRMSGNVLTQSMLPIAVALIDRVEIAGCDGRNANENYCWRHHASTQCSDDFMRSAFDASLAFCPGQNYADYYDGASLALEEPPAAGEAAGEKVLGLTPSHIPALRWRGAPALDG